MQLLESKIQEAKAKKDTLLARARTAKFVTFTPYYPSLHFLWKSLSIENASSRFIYYTNSLFLVYIPARTATKVQEMIGTVNTSGALSAFEKMEEKGTPHCSF